LNGSGKIQFPTQKLFGNHSIDFVGGVSAQGKTRIARWE
jgi:hypothetical protein